MVAVFGRSGFRRFEEAIARRLVVAALERCFGIDMIGSRIDRVQDE